MWLSRAFYYFIFLSGMYFSIYCNSLFLTQAYCHKLQFFRYLDIMALVATFLIVPYIGYIIFRKRRSDVDNNSRKFVDNDLFSQTLKIECMHSENPSHFWINDVADVVYKKCISSDHCFMAVNLFKLTKLLAIFKLHCSSLFQDT